jgi:hypothetical protein
MTAIDRLPESSTPKPNLSLDDLKARYANVREPILVALHILLQESKISLENAKGAAKSYGVRITAASVAAARRLMERMDAAPVVPPAPVPTAAARPARRPRTVEPAQDAEGLIRGVVAKLQAQGNAEAEKLRATIRRAVELLQSALT